jgi:FkbM family methyltransferase
LTVDGVKNSREAVSVTLTSIDHLVDEQSIENVKLIKVDVEGFELDVIKRVKDTWGLEQ